MSANEPLNNSRQASYDSTLMSDNQETARRRNNISVEDLSPKQFSPAPNSSSIPNSAGTIGTSRIFNKAGTTQHGGSIEDVSKAGPPEFSIKDGIDLLQLRSILLENKGSVARDHLANERTFLAWLRTSLSFITIGIGVTQLFRLENKSTHVEVNGVSSSISGSSSKINKFGKPLGVTFIALGIVTLILGLVRFFKVQIMLTKNYFPASRLSLVVLIVVVLAIVLTTLAMVIQAA